MKNQKNNSADPMDYDYLKASSAQDCTGLIPTGIKDDSEVENYTEIYPFLPRVPKSKKENRPDDLSSEPE